MTLHPPGKAPIASDAGRAIFLLPRPSRLATPQSIALRPLVPVLKREAEEDWPRDGQASALTRRGEGAVQEEWGNLCILGMYSAHQRGHHGSFHTSEGRHSGSRAAEQTGPSRFTRRSHCGDPVWGDLAFRHAEEETQT